MPAFAVLCCALGLLAQSNDEAALNQQYKSKILTLRHSFRSNSQNYDASGTQFTRGKKARGTLYARIQVMEVRMRNDSLEIRGRRTSLVNENGCLSDYGIGQSPLHLPEPVGSVATVRIQLAPGDSPQPAMGRVFALTEQDLIASVPVPDLWKDYVRTRLDPRSTGGQWEFTPGQAEVERLAKQTHARLASASSGTGHNAPGVVAPAILQRYRDTSQLRYTGIA